MGILGRSLQGGGGGRRAPPLPQRHSTQQPNRPLWRANNNNRFPIRKTFRIIILILAFIALLPPLLFHFRLRRFHQILAKKCGWMNNPPLVCAHGGDSAHAFPNTMAAYQLALSSQVDCVEVDVSRSVDGVLFAIHDRLLCLINIPSLRLPGLDFGCDAGRDLQRITGNSSLRVGHLNMEEIKQLIVPHQLSHGLHNQTIPTLEDALTFISSSVQQVILDAKIGPPSYEKGLAKDILSIVSFSVWAYPHLVCYVTPSPGFFLPFSEAFLSENKGLEFSVLENMQASSDLNLGSFQFLLEVTLALKLNSSSHEEQDNLGQPPKLDNVISENCLVFPPTGLKIIYDLFFACCIRSSNPDSISLFQVYKTHCKRCLVWTKSDSLARDVIKFDLERTVPNTHLQVGYIVMVDPDTGMRSNLLRMKGAGVVGVSHHLIDEKLVKILHGRSKKVYAWTVDAMDSMRNMLLERVDAVITNKPNALQGLMQDIRTQCLEEGFSLTS
ncbi:hypothetical protein Tsubulata_026910 [Turnera subulata]|uniref:glycerophosphodiester phosphodiesterase n=1 Tax=Turnera subulata TaxID=218843 RepID=A0A9Q0FUG9_9ROSI|nr:hypothetical protein Tsubulata_026910 [Turnera subulata]